MYLVTPQHCISLRNKHKRNHPLQAKFHNHCRPTLRCMSVSAINYLHTPIMSHQENVDLWDRPAMKCEKKRRGAITPTSNAAQHRRRVPTQNIWWLGQSQSLWKWSFGCECWLLPHTYVDSYTSAVFLMGKCNYFSVPLSLSLSNNKWPALNPSLTVSTSPLRFSYSLLAFCRDFQLFGSSQENSHQSAKVPRSRIVFNLEGGEMDRTERYY